MAQSGSYTPISLYHSETPSAVPAVGDLEVGEIAINIADRKVYTKNTAEELVEITNGTNHTHVAGAITDFSDAVLSVINENIIQANRPTITTQTGTSYTLTAEDETSIIRFTNGSAVTVTVPTDAAASLPDGYIVHLHQAGAGQVTVAGASGVTVNSSSTLSARAQYAALSLFKLGTNDWVLVGDQQ
jgi:hypothetical protein